MVSFSKGCYKGQMRRILRVLSPTLAQIGYMVAVITKLFFHEQSGPTCIYSHSPHSPQHCIVIKFKHTNPALRCPFTSSFSNHQLGKVFPFSL